MTDRGALTDCDGSGIINWFGGAVQNADGRFLADCMFQPTGVNPYYLALKQVSQGLGAPVAISATPSAGGSLTSGTLYYYKITAIDGTGGETLASNEISATPAGGNLSNTLVWNSIPNAFGYKVYRGTTSGTEILLTGADLPKLQPSPLTATVTFIDTGADVAFTQATTGASASMSGGNPIISFTWTASVAPSLPVGQKILASGYTPGTFNGTFPVSLVGFNPLTHRASVIVAGGPGSGSASINGTISTSTQGPPIADTTQQTALYAMPAGIIPVSYSNTNIVALFPASITALGQIPSGGSGGGGTTGSGISGQGASTPSGGIVGLVGPLPQMVQFTNRICIALGNGFPPQIYSGATGTSVNPAFGGVGGTAAPITSVAVSGDQVTVTTSATLTALNLPVGSNVILQNMSDATYNGVFPVLSVNIGAKTFVVRNPTASGGASTGAFIVSTTPITNTFIPAYPTWAASSGYAVNSIIQPTANTPNKSYFKAIQGGTSGTVEPTWVNFDTLGQEVSDGQIIWQNQGPLQSAAPAPPGAGHIYVYSGCLWVLNTFPKNTTSGIDGPCSLRQSDVNNPFSWNPINQAFLDKDDGTEGMGMATFTISAEGIPPEGSLVAFKNYAGYQIVGIFGSSIFSIQRIRSDMGCTAPRSIWFVPGYGVARYAHLGVALFDGVRDTIVSEEMRPYLFPTNDVDNSDITVADANFLPLSQGALTANPPMYVLAIPIGNSNGQLTRILNFDLVLKCWGGPIDLPFPISTLTQVRPVTSNPITIFGGFSDGVLQRWQAGDVQWYTGDPLSITPVVWAMTAPEAYGNPADQKLHWRRLAIRGVSTGISAKLTVVPYVNGNAKPAQQYTVPVNGDFEVFAGMRIEGLRFHAVISGSGHLEINRLDYQLYPKAVGTPMVIS